MRNLTIQRTKSFVGSAGKIVFYIEDPTSEEIVINGTPCRKLGTLKNGETQTFAIDDGACKVYATPFKNVKAAKKFFFDYYKVPEGTEDWFLSGKCQFNPGAGNGFLFDNVTDEEILANRKANSKKSIPVTIASIAVGVIIGLVFAFVLNPPAKAKTFKNDDFSITLTNEYKVADPSEFGDEYSYVFESDYAYVIFTRDDFSLAEGMEDYTIEQYVDIVAWLNDQDSWDLKESDGITYYEYEEEVDGDDFMYFATFYKDKDCFWLVQYMTFKENYKEMKPDFIKYSKSIVFHE